jgi:hypothetical protein
MASDRDLWGDELLWDHLILDCDGQPVGMVDDLELTDSDDETGPILSALLCGPTAFGPRIGGRLGFWWLSVAQRLRSSKRPAPRRIPLAIVESINAEGVHLSLSREDLPSPELKTWVLDKVIDRIPGHGA